MVDQLVAGEGVRPGCEWQGSVVALALQMYGKESFLDEIFDFAGGAADAAREVPTQIAAQDGEELTVRARIPLQAANHQWPEALFGLILLRHGKFDSLAARKPQHFNAGDPSSTNPD